MEAQADQEDQHHQAAEVRVEEVLEEDGTGSSSGLPSWMQENRVTRAGRLRAGGLGDAARAVGYRYQRKVVNGVKSLPKTGGRWLRKGAEKLPAAMLGGSLALAGAAVGAASGDPGKALQYALAGGAAGFSGANYYTTRAGNALAAEAGEATKTASAAFWGDQAKARQQYLFDKNFKSDPANIDTLTKALGSRDEAKAAMQDRKSTSIIK